MISFRTRLFLIAALIVAAVLATVLALIWSSTLKFEVERLDEQLCMEARRIATRPTDGGQNLELDLLGKLRLSSAGQLMARFEPAFDDSGFQVGQARLTQSIDALPWQAAKRFNSASAREHPAAPPPPPEFAPPEFLPAGPRPRGSCSLASFEQQNRSWHAALFKFPRGRSFVAADLAAPKAELQQILQQALKIVIPLAIVLTGLGAWLLASLSMKPLNRLREAMKNVDQKALDQRLPNSGEDREFKELIDAYNTMLGRLETSFMQASRFSADAAHELKTPLTILRGQIEQAITRSDNRAIQLDLSTMLDEVSRLASITRKLLLLSQADAGQLALHMSHINLTQLLETLIEDRLMLLQGQQLQCDISPNLTLSGDADLLTQLFNNLFSNALRYCPAKGSIQISARPSQHGIELLVSNTCQLITQQERQRLFERFYRGDAAHNREIDGHGLGLSLALEIARAHGGKLSLQPSAPDQFQMNLWLPSR